MDLFYVKRYEGEQEITKDEEDIKLNKLFQKIEKKKLQRKKVFENDLTETIKTPIQENGKEGKYQNENDIIESKEVNLKRKAEDSSEPTQKIKRIKNELPINIEGFTVLGAENTSRKGKVKRVLPKWLAEPTIISIDLKELRMKVSSMKVIDKDLRKKLKVNGVQFLFPVQAEVIPWLLQESSHSSAIRPRDICVSAPTGSGKTLAFVLPVIQALKRHFSKKIRALVVLPTQDLAFQVFKTFKIYCENTNVDVCFITRENTFASEQKLLINESVEGLSRADIVVCTAGRLVDHLKHTEKLDLRDLEFLIIDEADRVLDTIQHDWLYHLENHLHQGNTDGSRINSILNVRKKKTAQKLLFSATLSQDPEKLQKISLFEPKLFTSVVEGTTESIHSEEKAGDGFIGKYTTPKELTEKYITCSIDIKPLVLYKYIKVQKLTRTLIFTNSINEAHRLCILLRELFKDKMKIVEMNSHLLIKSRKELISEFSKGNIDIIICTDSLARGIDLPEVQCVISYTAPKHLKTYIHRAGRTARAGSLGTAVTLLHTTQVARFKSLLEHAKKNNVEELNLPTDDLESLGKTYKIALQELKRILTKEEVENLKKIKSTKQLKPKFKRKETNSNISN